MSLNRKQYKYNEIEIINLYNKGLNSVQIAEYYNYPKHTYKTISKILKKNGKILTGKRLTYTLDDENKICDLYNEGYTQLEILNMFDNINSEATIYNILSKHNIPKEFMSHFIRGCFDGDGSAFISSGYFRIAYYGSHKICQDILDIMGFKSKVYDKETVSFFSIQKKEYVEKFYNYIYKDATIYMHRKRNLFEKFMQK